RVKKLSAIAVAEDRHRQVKGTVELPVEFRHEEIGDAFVLHTFQQGLFEGVRKRPMADVVKQDGQLGGLIFFVCDLHILVPEAVEHTPHQVHGTQRVLKTGMERTGVYEVRQTELPDVTQPLEPGMGYYIEY